MKQPTYPGPAPVDTGYFDGVESGECVISLVTNGKAVAVWPSDGTLDPADREMQVAEKNVRIERRADLGSERESGVEGEGSNLSKILGYGRRAEKPVVAMPGDSAQLYLEEPFWITLQGGAAHSHGIVDYLSQAPSEVRRPKSRL